MLSARQEFILCKVVESYLHTGQPVASKVIAADPGLDCGPSTVRNELALLEECGLLDHPHTSAGRIPTDAGHRHVVDQMLASGTGLLPAPSLRLSLMRQEVEEAMRATTATLSQVTDLLAVVSAPSSSTATIRHIEVLALQPRVVAAVIITSTGSVSKVLATFQDPVEPGLVAWAGEYLNERLVGLTLGARMLQQRLADPAVSPTERAFLDALTVDFAELAPASEDVLYLEGAARLFSAAHLRDVDQINELLELLERRVALLGALRAALAEPDVYVRIGQENEIPAMRSLGMVAAGYGMPRRKLGIVSVIGPVHMDYANAIPTVREVAHELSRFVQDAYAER
jgi:heat-inducible transcriptional repressor